MAIELTESAVSGRSIRLSDILIAFDPSDTSADSVRSDTLTEVIATIRSALLEAIQDNLGGPAANGTDGFIRSGSGISIVYDDTAGTLTVRVAVMTLDVFLANSSNVNVGDSIDPPFTSTDGDFDVAIRTTRAARRWGFVLPEGRTLAAIYNNGGADITSDFVRPDAAGQPRRYVQNSDNRAGGSNDRVLIRTR